MNYQLIIWITGLMLLAYWFNYLMGRPNTYDEQRIDVGAIFYFLPLWLADRRLKKLGLFWAVQEEHNENLATTKDLRLREQLRKDWRRARLDVGREFFTWERSIMCAVCFHWWITLIFGAVCLSFNLLHAREDLLLAGFTYLLNHFFIRKIS